MEIKIVCPSCGTKFAFEVEPIHGRMPAPVNCPECGMEATQEANAIIQSNLAAAATTAAAAHPQAPGPSAPGQVARPATLRINRPAAPEPAANQSGEGYAAATVPPPPPTFSTAPARPSGAKSTVVKALSTVLVVICAGYGAWRVGYRWFKRLSIVAQIASVAGEASVKKGDSEDGGARNLWYEDEAVLFIKYTNHTEIANACKSFWKEQLHRDLTVINQLQDAENSGEYELIAPHHGYVRIVGAYAWPVPEQEALAQHLSRKFGTMVFEWRSEHVGDTYHFGVFDQGTRKFHAQMDIKFTKDNAAEKVTTDGNDFAIANGYKPGAEGFKEFNVLDADKITQRLGMKLWDEKEQQTPQGLFLKEVGAPAGKTPASE